MTVRHLEAGKTDEVQVMLTFAGLLNNFGFYSSNKVLKVLEGHHPSGVIGTLKESMAPLKWKDSSGVLL